jgi:ribosomal 50S subunit-recycling heat shock protein
LLRRRNNQQKPSLTFIGQVLFFVRLGKVSKMRLDKYLKVTRIIKRRTVANDACDSEHVTVNGKRAKASYDVKVGDVIEINMGTRPLKVKVLNVTEHATKENAADNYTVIG